MAFAISFDGATVEGKSFLDVRVRLCVREVENVYLVAQRRVLEGETSWNCDGRRPEHDGTAYWGCNKADRGNFTRFLSRMVCSASARLEYTGRDFEPL
jgi:hypothetical protein